ncbi:fibrinogen-like protein 1 [Cochliomyia hominivorax]
MQIGLIFLVFLGFRELKAEEEFSSEIIKNSDLSEKVDKIKNQLKDIKTEIIQNLDDQKLEWQLDILQNWFRDEEKQKCSGDLNYIFPDWWVLQKRLDGSENFYRNWSDYKQGFGDKRQEYFMGLEPLYEMGKTKGPLELLIVLGDHNMDMKYAKYDHFIVGSEKEDYKLKELGLYKGNAGDALSEQVGEKFTTLDRDNDNSKLHNCAKLWRGAWWFGFCHQSHLNGPYLEQPVSDKGEKGIVWDLWHGMNYSLKFVLMMVRSSSNQLKEK